MSKKKKVSEKENEWKGILQENKINCVSTDFYQVGKSNITPDSVTSANVNNETVEKIKLKDYEAFKNVDWSKLYQPELPLLQTPYKNKRIDFEFTPLTFWQLLPSIAVNLHCNEIELTWLCFGMYVKFKK